MHVYIDITMGQEVEFKRRIKEKQYATPTEFFRSKVREILDE